ncbi:Uncharacterized protein BC141101_05880 [Bacillus toyonensis]|uniref:hypothetical protein n=1 Tax=Bacillus toyonensis TaxID=155322 RepID=UPI00027BE9A5|nr:hypothetical protein [Bacillus toyonensis]EJV41923.1 hypothetical protein IEA_05551 [Bacillus toyonensis]EJV89897.1 hypothetical protein IGI_05541 [Bacillus toyonensis]EOP32044.1 hypothetical protein IG5_05707 [Bacillus toyonensis]SCN20500.1 Uncharacterized protein BC141101_05880 [Bacillus toyonensis]HDR7423129.1 hypothetical protein [Bacillus toyonensis]
MLDQNTDRSWWMIGAVSVGGVLLGAILIAFPEVLQSVITIFKQKLAVASK